MSRDPEAVVRDLIATAYHGGRAREAFERCVAEEYIQHNPDVPDGREAGIGFFEQLWQMLPGFRYDLHHVLVADDLVGVHGRGSSGLPGDPGRALFDLFRVAGGRIVEHWDVVQDIPASAANAHPMFGHLPAVPPGPARPADPGAGEAVLGLLEKAFQGKDVDGGFATHVAADGYIQHNPGIADGRDAAVAFFHGLWEQFPDFRYEPRHVLANGDMVGVHAFASNGSDRGAALFDLFRVADGRIVEHWDVVQMIPETAANDHPMF